VLRPERPGSSSHEVDSVYITMEIPVFRICSLVRSTQQRLGSDVVNLTYVSPYNGGISNFEECSIPIGTPSNRHYG
jgi:hypothetical protein